MGQFEMSNQVCYGMMKCPGKRNSYTSFSNLARKSLTFGVALVVPTSIPKTAVWMKLYMLRSASS